MKAVRIIAATILAPCIAVLPYLVFARYAFTHFAGDGGAAARGVLDSAELVLVGAILAVVSLSVARFSWTKDNEILQRNLFGWPIGIAIVFVLLLIVPAWLQGMRMFIIVITTAAVACATGVVAAKFWLRWSYED
jgi:hypothetical protein